MAQKTVKKKKALFVTVEGLEGSGKSSLIKTLEGLIKSRKLSCKIYREPGTTRVGEKIRKILLDKNNSEISPHTELLLYLAARTQLIEEKLKKDINIYDVIICDRFFDSTLVYQGYALGLGKAAERGVDIFSLGFVPDITFFLDVDPKLGLSRLKGRDRIESRPLSFHNRLREGYLQLAKINSSRIKIINARASLGEVSTAARKLLEGYLENR
ncbi:MAG: dTMP kinase [Candidatus Omnitrophica bacterium]|nr:dTMP kinase [Candidatus Omnitrophota bacterium]MDD5429593.1 dTMP kinase [Candidatus Omnitrophota bacterium]